MGSVEARSAAESYRSFGWNPIPIKAHTKQPSLSQLAPYLERHATDEEFESWEFPAVGVVTGRVSNLVVLDADGDEGVSILKEHGHPVTPTARTPSGGLHAYFRHPPGLHVPTSIRISPGLDLKAAKGYVVAPPSSGSNGKNYEWLISPEETSLAELPSWVLERIRRFSHNGSAAYQVAGERIALGERNNTLTSFAGSWRRTGMDVDEIYAGLKAINATRCDPPLDDEEVRQIARSVGRYEPVRHIHLAGEESTNGGSPTGREGFNLTDMGNAERFISRHGQRVRYCYEIRSWFVFDGVRWVRDVGGGRASKLAKETVRSIYREASKADDEADRKAIAKHAARSEAAARVEAMLKLAECEVPVTPDELDSDLYLLNCLSGTVDLRTGHLREHRREDYITKLAPVDYDPKAEAPTFEAFLKRVQPKQEVRAFLKRAVGYSATADTSEQCLFIDHGGGMNGKSTFAEVISTTLGDYAQRAPTEMLMLRRSGGIPNDVARLKGARFVTASETEEGRRLAESLVKDLTGSDTLTARFMRAEFFDFTPTHKLWLSTNHKPEIRGTDLAIWRRIRLIPWSVKIPPADQDKKLPEKIRAELPGVLAWVVAGCLEWQDQGLTPPEEVQKATKAYRAESDVLAGFLADCCKIGEAETEYATALWKAWQRWAEQSGETVGTQNRFGGKLRERGFLNLRDSRTGRKMWRGLSLLPDWENWAGIPLNLSTLRFAGNSELSEPSEPKNNINSSENTREEVMCKKGSGGSGGSGGDSNRRLTEDETRQVQKLIAEGMEPTWARAAVIGDKSEEGV